jgi:hypothetical protein
MLELRLGIDVDQAGLGGGDVGFGIREPGAVVAIVDAEQNVPGPDRLIVIDFDDCDVTANLRREGGHVPAHIGVVGRRLSAGPEPCPSCRRDNDGRQAEHHAEELLGLGDCHGGGLR